jgi:hypothetical protein
MRRMEAHGGACYANEAHGTALSAGGACGCCGVANEALSAAPALSKVRGDANGVCGVAMLPMR